MSFNLSPFIYKTLDVWKIIQKKYIKNFDDLFYYTHQESEKEYLDKLLSYVDIDAMVEQYEAKQHGRTIVRPNNENQLNQI